MNTLARLRCVGLGCVVWLGQFENRDVSRRTFSGGNFRISFYSCRGRMPVEAKERQQPVATSPNLDDMKLPELKELAKQMGLRGVSTMRKTELIATLQAARSGGEAPAGGVTEVRCTALRWLLLKPAADAEVKSARLRNPASPTRLPKAGANEAVQSEKQTAKTAEDPAGRADSVAAGRAEQTERRAHRASSSIRLTPTKPAPTCSPN